MTEIFPRTAKLPAAIADLAGAIEADGGAALASYQDPIGGHWQIFALLPIGKVMPTPFQRDLSPAHMKRLTEVMKRLDRYTEPIVAVRQDGQYWTPNGNHRRAAAGKLGAKMIPAIVIPETDVAYKILALNTEKTHNLKDKALEVIRMYRARMEQRPKAIEKDFAFEFERAHFITLGLLYEKKPRFAGGAYVPILSRVDNFLNRPMREAMEERIERATQVERADDLLNEIVAKAKRRGLAHPYLKNFVVARCNPLTRARKTIPACKTALSSLCKVLEAFDLARINFAQVRSAAQIAAASSQGASG